MFVQKPSQNFACIECIGKTSQRSAAGVMIEIHLPQLLGVHVIAIGVGSHVDTEELSVIALGQRQNVLLMTSFDEVLAKAKNIIDQLARSVCRKT